MRLASWALAPALCASLAGPAAATVTITVDLRAQRLHAADGRLSYTWPISSGGDGYATPDGRFRPQRLIADAHSNLYANAPMPHAIFFLGPYAIHGTYETRFLGHPVSHGCVRLPPAAASTLFALVKKEGAAITIEGAAPKGWHVYGKKHPVGPMAVAAPKVRAKPAAKRVAMRAVVRPVAPRAHVAVAAAPMAVRRPVPVRVYYGAAASSHPEYPRRAYRPGLIGWVFGDTP
ncbi:MAG: L,D-transpeptidase [Hyphomicrobiales bacterium]|nr:L,D-transpeptidase [Hyphomicrobiales bacterium]MDE2017432.1 L,D-transpeptidase [Hyphomicrobiales bacterium]